MGTYYTVEHFLDLRKSQVPLNGRKHLPKYTIGLVVLFSDPAEHIIWPQCKAVRDIASLQRQGAVQHVASIVDKPVRKLSRLNIGPELSGLRVTDEVLAFGSQEE